MPFGIPSEDFHGGFGLTDSAYPAPCAEGATKILNVTMICKAVYNSSIKVPAHMTLEEAIAYAKDHTEEIAVSDMEWIADEEIDEDNCDFNEE